MNAILIGPDDGLRPALESEGIETTALEGVATGDRLAAAGVANADLLLITDVGEATAVPVSREANPDIRVVIYSTDSMPEFVRGQVDFAVSPDVLSPAILAEELAAAA